MPARSSRDSTDRSPQRVIADAVAERVFAPVYYFHGDDDYLKDNAQAQLLEAAIDPATREFNCEVRRAVELGDEDVERMLSTPPMFADRRAIVLRDIGSMKKQARAQLERYLARPAPDTLLIVVATAGTKVDSALRDRSLALEFTPLTPERVRRWIAHQCTTRLAMPIDDAAIQLLQHAVGSDLQQLEAELDKCASYVSGVGASMPSPSARITVDVVGRVVGVRRGETLSDLLDAVAHQDAARAVPLVSFVLSQPKMAAVPILSALTTQTLALAWGRARRDSGVPLPRLASEYFGFLKETGAYPGRPWGEAASLWTRETERWSSAACHRALALLLDADHALKETRVSTDEQLLTTLVLSLCALSRTRRSAA
jgi:DNA polymerase-3 subunit delta